MTTLLAYPNVSDGRDGETIAAVARAFGPALLDVHSDPDHHRSAFTLAAPPGELAATVVAGAAEAVARIAIDAHDGVHPRVGVLDVAPIVHVDPADRGAACAEALVLADRLASELGLPILLYGALAGGRTRAELRRGGPQELARRITAGELTPDFAPAGWTRAAPLHLTAGATLVAARPPLIAFNLLLADGVTLQAARATAAAIREGGRDGLPAVRAIGLWLDSQGRAQVSTNLDDWSATSPAQVTAAVAAHVAIAEAELVGLAPRAAFADFPDTVALTGLATIEDAVATMGDTA
jgi:glutamate formiminotransferase